MVAISRWSYAKAIGTRKLMKIRKASQKAVGAALLASMLSLSVISPAIASTTVAPSSASAVLPVPSAVVAPTGIGKPVELTDQQMEGVEGELEPISIGIGVGLYYASSYSQALNERRNLQDRGYKNVRIVFHGWRFAAIGNKN